MNSIFHLDSNDCEPNPCEHGSCNVEVNGYTCDCDVGWEGTNCDRGKMRYVDMISLRKFDIFDFTRLLI